MQRSKLVLGFVVALGVGGLGAAAVAMENDTGGSGSLASEPTTTVGVDPSTTVVTVAPTPTTTVAPTTAAAGSAEGTDGTDPGVDRSTDGCDGVTYANHGDYVSSIAHDPNRQPGDVPAAAQSDCGKPISSVDGGADDEGSETPEASTPDASDDGVPGQGQGKGKGLGKG
jgi:hypothetical protein